MQACRDFFVRLAQFTQPIDQMEIAQAAGRLFDARFEMIKRVLKFLVAFARQLAKMAGQWAGLAFEESRKLAFELGVQIRRTGQQAAIEQADAEFDIAFVDFGAFGHSADRMAEPQPGVPEHADEFGERVLDSRGLRIAFDQDEHVDIGERK